jgi:hypothetical protein
LNLISFSPPSLSSFPSQRVVNPSSLSIEGEEEEGEKEEGEKGGEALEPPASSKQPRRRRKKQKVCKWEGALTTGREGGREGIFIFLKKLSE